MGKFNAVQTLFDYITPNIKIIKQLWQQEKKQPLKM